MKSVFYFICLFFFFCRDLRIDQHPKMLTCIARPKKPGNDSVSKPDDSDPNNAANAAKNQAIKSLTSQVSVEAMELKIEILFMWLLLVCNFLLLWSVILDKGYGVEGVGGVQALRPLHRASNAGSTREQ